jgi:hypothetical protein
MKKTDRKSRHKGPLTFEVGEIELVSGKPDRGSSWKRKIKLFLWFGFWALVILVFGFGCC